MQVTSLLEISVSIYKMRVTMVRIAVRIGPLVPRSGCMRAVLGQQLTSMSAMALWACLRCMGRFVTMGAEVSLQPTSPLTPSVCLQKKREKEQHQGLTKETGALLLIFNFECGQNPVFLEKV